MTYYHRGFSSGAYKHCAPAKPHSHHNYCPPPAFHKIGHHGYFAPSYSIKPQAPSYYGHFKPKPFNHKLICCFKPYDCGPIKPWYPKPEPKPDPRPEPKPEPKPDPKPDPKPEPKPDPKPEPKPEPKPDPKPEPKPDPKPEPKPEPKPNPKPDEECKDCLDDGNQNNKFGGKDTDKGNIINVEKVEKGATTTNGTSGKDTIYGTDGEDIIYAGSGADVVYGGAGNDTIHGGNNGDTLYGDAGKDYLNGGAGNDYLNGGTGADIMRGAAGNDVYFVDNANDVVIEDPNGGTDTVRSAIDYTLPDNVEDLILQGLSNLNGYGNDLNNTINGNAGNNKLFGMGGDDCLVGKDGDDYLDGGIGNDVLIGGQGNDTYFFDKGYCYDIIEDAGGKNDTLLFGKGISASDVILSKEGDDLSIKFANSTDSILVGDWFVGSDNQIENFKFADGTTYEVSGYNSSSLSLAQVQEQAQAAAAVV